MKYTILLFVVGSCCSVVPAAELFGGYVSVIFVIIAAVLFIFINKPSLVAETFYFLFFL